MYKTRYTPHNTQAKINFLLFLINFTIFMFYCLQIHFIVISSWWYVIKTKKLSFDPLHQFICQGWLDGNFFTTFHFWGDNCSNYFSPLLQLKWRYSHWKKRPWERYFWLPWWLLSVESLQNGLSEVLQIA